MQILVISKKLVNKLHSVGLVISLWLGVSQRITNENSNFVTCSNNLIKNSQAVKKGAAPKKAMVKKDVKSKVAAKKWL